MSCPVFKASFFFIILNSQDLFFYREPEERQKKDEEDEFAEDEQYVEPPYHDRIEPEAPVETTEQPTNVPQQQVAAIQSWADDQPETAAPPSW
jgi:hypothetical protein